MGGDSSGSAMEPPGDEPRRASFRRPTDFAIGASLEQRIRTARGPQAAPGRHESGIAPDISEHIFSGEKARYAQLFEAMPTYFSYSILTLLIQSDEAFEALGGAIDREQVMVDPGWFGRLAAYFSGYVSNDSGLVLGTRLPTLDLEIAPTFKVSFKNLYRTARTSTFKVKVMGIGGTGARLLTQTMGTSFGPYSCSCQLQAPVDVEWRSYVRAATGDRLVTLKFLPTGTVGLYVASEDDPDYKRIEAPRDARLAIVNRSGEKPTELTWRIRRGFKSNFEVPLTLAIGPLTSTYSILVDSQVTAELGIKLTHQGPGGHLYGCGRDAVLLRLGP